MITMNQYDRLKLHLYDLQAVIKEINEELNDPTLHNFLLTLYDFEQWIKKQLEPHVMKPKVKLPEKVEEREWKVVDEDGRVIE